MSYPLKTNATNFKQDIFRRAIAELRTPRVIEGKEWCITIDPTGATENTVKVEYTTRELVNAAGYLARQNMLGFHIYFRPIARCHVVIDDLAADSIRQMVDDDIATRLIVETSPRNYQVWLRFSESEEIESALLKEVSRIVTRRYAGDIYAVAAERAGRLPGLTNRKKEHQSPNGKYPWVRIRSVNEILGKSPPMNRDVNNKVLLEEVRSSLAQNASSLSTRRGCAPIGQLDTTSHMTATEAMAIYTEIDTALRKTFPDYSDITDRSGKDFQVATWLAKREWRFEDMVEVIYHGSEKARQRPKEEYATLTVKKAVDYVKAKRSTFFYN